MRVVGLNLLTARNVLLVAIGDTECSVNICPILKLNVLKKNFEKCKYDTEVDIISRILDNSANYVLLWSFLHTFAWRSVILGQMSSFGTQWVKSEI